MAEIRARRMRLVAPFFAVVLAVGVGSVGDPARAHGLAGGPIEYVKTIPFDAGAAQVAKRVGDYLYVTSWKALSVYEVSDLLNPTHISTIPTGFQFPAERMDTNGQILIIAEQTPLVAIDSPLNRMHVFDVSDPAAPAEIAILDGTPDHTFTCVQRCKFAYGSHGSIVDLRDPHAPTIVGDWSELTLTYFHDVTEVSPGRVLTASMPTMRLLDGRKAIAKPQHVAAGDATATQSRGYLGTVEWPRQGRDRFILGSEESSFSGRCSENTSAFITWDTKDWRSRRTFQYASSYRLTNGTVTDGSPPVAPIGCSTHVFDAHPDFRNGGLVSLAHYEHGTRVMEVGSDGSIKERGWFLPFGGSTSASYWMSKDIIYSIDFHRGIDILRYTG